MFFIVVSFHACLLAGENLNLPEFPDTGNYYSSLQSSAIIRGNVLHLFLKELHNSHPCYKEKAIPAHYIPGSGDVSNRRIRLQVVRITNTVPPSSQLSVHARLIMAGTSSIHSAVTLAGAAASTGKAASRNEVLYYTLLP
jgi:hypothetical protein